MTIKLDTINLNDIDAGDRIPDGEYVGKIMEPIERPTKKNNTPALAYYIIVQEGEFAGRRVYDQWLLTENALWRMKRDFRRMNYKPADGHVKPADIDGFVGTFKLVTKPDKQGEDRQNVEWLAPLM